VRPDGSPKTRQVWGYQALYPALKQPFAALSET
jgi:hypothetical protein